jgi:hypothetical protein
VTTHAQTPAARARGAHCRQTARARLLEPIRDALDTGLPPACTPEPCRLKCAAVFARVYGGWPDRERGVYGGVG